MSTGDLKSDRVAGAYAQMRISGITVQASPENNDKALGRLESLMNELFVRDVCIGYNFEDEPDSSSTSGIPSAYYFTIDCILAGRLLSDFGKGAADKVDPILLRNMSAQTSFLFSSTAKPRQTQYPNRQAVGSGNTLRSLRYQRYYRDTPQAPNTCASNTMVVGDVDDFVEHFDSWLIDGEVISSYTIEADTGLTITLSSNNDTDVLYRITAAGNNSTGSDALLQVKIIATTDNTRVATRLINFELINLSDTP